MKKKIVFIGNSIVNGFPYSRGSSFPGLIRAAIKASATGSNEDDSTASRGAGYAKATIAADIINKGENGQTTRDILGRFDHDVLDHHPVAVFIMTGTNDFIYKESTPETAFGNLEEMAGRAEDAGIIPVYMTPLEVDADLAGKMWMAGLGIDYEEVNRQINRLAELIRRSSRLYVDTCIAYQQYALSGSTTDDGSSPGDSTMVGDYGVSADDGSSSSEASMTGGHGVSADGGSSSGEGDRSGADFAAYHDGVHPTREGYAYLADTVLKWIEEHSSSLGL